VGDTVQAQLREVAEDAAYHIEKQSALISELYARIANLEAENARLTRELDSAERRVRELSNDMWSDVEFQWRQLVDIPEDSLTPGGQAIRRQLIEAARKSLGVDALKARPTRERNELKASLESAHAAYERERQYHFHEVSRLKAERDQILAQRDYARRNCCELEAMVNEPEGFPVERAEWRKRARVRFAERFGPGEGKRLFPERKTDDEGSN